MPARHMHMHMCVGRSVEHELKEREAAAAQARTALQMQQEAARTQKMNIEKMLTCSLCFEVRGDWLQCVNGTSIQVVDSVRASAPRRVDRCFPQFWSMRSACFATFSFEFFSSSSCPPLAHYLAPIITDAFVCRVPRAARQPASASSEVWPAARLRSIICTACFVAVVNAAGPVCACRTQCVPLVHRDSDAGGVPDVQQARAAGLAPSPKERRALHEGSEAFVHVVHTCM